MKRVYWSRHKQIQLAEKLRRHLNILIRSNSKTFWIRAMNNQKRSILFSYQSLIDLTMTSSIWWLSLCSQQVLLRWRTRRGLPKVVIITWTRFARRKNVHAMSTIWLLQLKTLARPTLWMSALSRTVMVIPRLDRQLIPQLFSTKSRVIYSSLKLSVSRNK